jgi:hypothetical protein
MVMDGLMEMVANREWENPLSSVRSISLAVGQGDSDRVGIPVRLGEGRERDNENTDEWVKGAEQNIRDGSTGREIPINDGTHAALLIDPDAPAKDARKLALRKRAKPLTRRVFHESKGAERITWSLSKRSETVITLRPKTRDETMDVLCKTADRRMTSEFGMADSLKSRLLKRVDCIKGFDSRLSDRI